MNDVQVNGSLRSSSRVRAYLLALLVASATALSASELPAPTPDGPRCSIDDPQNRVGEIEVDPRNIFDLGRPGENRWLFRLANRLHWTTRPRVIKDQLVFRSGEPFSRAALAESERVLRANHYIYEAHVEPLRCEDHKVDVGVLTRDVWTLEGGITFHRAGGTNSSSFELQDINFLGTGKRVEVARTANVDRTSRLVRYGDPNLFGSRARLDLLLADNSDGQLRSADFERPFYSLDARWAAGAQGFMDERVDSLYTAGKITDQFRHQQNFLEVYGGLSPGLVDGASARWRLGFTVDRNRFSPPEGTAPFSLLPPRRELAYPWIGYQWIEDGYTTERDLDRLRRVEDFNLGRQLDLRLGLSSPTWGGDRDRVIASGTASAGWRPLPSELLLGTLFATGRYAEGRAENVVVSADLHLYARDWGTSLTFVNLEGVFAHRLDADSQLLLGGDNGLRGYPLRFEQGDRRLLLNLEQRFYSDREYFHLVNFGAAVFFDAGRAWFVGSHAAAEERLLKDIGAGLRIGSSRSARGSVVHLDLAFPLGADRSIKRVQWLVSTSESF